MIFWGFIFQNKWRKVSRNCNKKSSELYDHNKKREKVVKKISGF